MYDADSVSSFDSDSEKWRLSFNLSHFDIFDEK